MANTKPKGTTIVININSIHSIVERVDSSLITISFAMGALLKGFHEAEAILLMNDNIHYFFNNLRRTNPITPAATT
jgi:hypothetical protein